MSCSSHSLNSEQSRNNKKLQEEIPFFVRKAQKWRDERFYHWNKKRRQKKEFFHPSPHMWTTTSNKRMFSTWPKQHAYEEWETILCMYIAFLQHELTHLLCSINLICMHSLLIHNICIYTCNATKKKILKGKQKDERTFSNY